MTGCRRENRQVRQEGGGNIKDREEETDRLGGREHTGSGRKEEGNMKG